MKELYEVRDCSLFGYSIKWNDYGDMEQGFDGMNNYTFEYFLSNGIIKPDSQCMQTLSMMELFEFSKLSDDIRFFGYVLSPEYAKKNGYHIKITGFIFRHDGKDVDKIEEIKNKAVDIFETRKCYVENNDYELYVSFSG